MLRVVHACVKYTSVSRHACNVANSYCSIVVSHRYTNFLFSLAGSWRCLHGLVRLTIFNAAITKIFFNTTIITETVQMKIIRHVSNFL